MITNVASIFENGVQLDSATAQTAVGGSIGDLVWADTNRNGVKDPAEGGINGVRVFADVDGDGLFDAG